VKSRVVFLAALLILVTSACGGASGPDIQVDDPWVRAALVLEMKNQDDKGASSGGEMGSHLGGSNSAAYMTIVNKGRQGDRLITVNSDIAQAVEIHISEMEDGVMTMHQVEGVDIPTRGRIELKPGGLHVMLIGLRRDLTAGDQVMLTLGFENSGEIVVEARVRAP
jgi:copper(I)-binding protein